MGQIFVAEVSNGFQGKRLVHKDVVSIAVDGCSVNIAAHAAIKKSYDIVWMLCLCLSHSTNNGRDEASFVILCQFWTLIQKSFSQSDNAKRDAHKTVSQSVLYCIQLFFIVLNNSRWHTSCCIVTNKKTLENLLGNKMVLQV
jgi:hypothetical protein